MRRLLPSAPHRFPDVAAVLIQPMTFFESLLALLAAAIVLLQVSRRLHFPYPAMLALAGTLLAFVPGVPTIRIEPDTALALFIAPVLLDAAFDFPVGAAQTLWRPLAIMAVGAVLMTIAAVAWVGVAALGLPLAAAVALGAIVAPPDAAAATAVLGSVSIPKRTIAVLKGESLFNDATALLLFGGALAVQANGGFSPGVAIRLAIAAPGGLAFGIAAGFAMLWTGRLVAGTLGGSILQFVNAYAVWILAEHLGLSAVLAEVGCAMTLAGSSQVARSPRNRVHSFAVWATVVFLLNVLAFLLMGMQARMIVEAMSGDRLRAALGAASAVILVVIAVRVVHVLVWNRVAGRYDVVRGALPRPTIGQGVFVAWCGMRGLVTVATAFALPGDFPQRDLVVLTAFGVVLATLVVQGLTLGPLIRMLKLDRLESADQDVADSRRALSEAGSAALAGLSGEEAGHVRYGYDVQGRSEGDRRYREAGLLAIAAERSRLELLRVNWQLDDAGYYRLQEEIDWRELTHLPEEERRIEDG